ncbi:MAG: class I SAM-dependent methyltransferase [Clostridia bacterium]|nr:class I SAM-dependent methyltransferase [Clostridia bacterium]
MADNSDTLNWYKENAKDFVTRTTDVDMSDHYRAFLKYIPAGGYIMDLGCGAGGAALHFTQAGYSVLAVDGCEELCEFTRLRAGCPVRTLRFEELDYEDSFDGVWACASLLHLRKSELPRVFRLIRRALKKDGVFYASFKYGELEREKNGRLFSDMTEDSIRGLISEAGGFREIDLWVTNDARPDRADEQWVNILCRAV